MSEFKVSATPEDRLRRAMKDRGIPVSLNADEVEAWIETSIIDLVSAKVALKRIAIDVLIMKKLLRRYLEQR